MRHAMSASFIKKESNPEAAMQRELMTLQEQRGLLIGLVIVL